MSKSPVLFPTKAKKGEIISAALAFEMLGAMYWISRFVGLKMAYPPHPASARRMLFGTGTPSTVIALSPSDMNLSSKIPPLSPDRVKPFEHPLRIPKTGKVNHDLDQFERDARKTGILEENSGAPANRESRKPAETRGWTGMKVNLPVFLSKSGGWGGIRTLVTFWVNTLSRRAR